MAAVEAGWADPRRLYGQGRRARALLDQSREIIAGGLGVRPDELSFHGSGPAALSCGLDGLLHARRRRGRTLVASEVERRVSGAEVSCAAECSGSAWAAAIYSAELLR